MNTHTILHSFNVNKIDFVPCCLNFSNKKLKKTLGAFYKCLNIQRQPSASRSIQPCVAVKVCTNQHRTGTDNYRYSNRQWLNVYRYWFIKGAKWIYIQDR